ncbi:type II secretion system protein [Vibrio sp. 99-8-1]|uniref:type II secretion system protein n=1 Tax=Vibrio sp. 99-8-1 TaxID=2607602 RepID=UPI001493993C|nr:type II secretion system protein [Vibrio sp. 99-8-1]NOI65906.1 type II secretion system protein [Vibrio sp. 99-8-1]
MKRAGGFTLIELVVVIVILGILAVTAAPRFLNLQKDARVASLQGLSGAINGAAGITFGKAAIEGLESKAKADNPEITEGSTTIKITYGYPVATDDGIGKAVTGLANTTDWTAFANRNNASRATSYRITFASNSINNYAGITTCYVQYDEPTTSGSAPVITVEDTCN